MNLKEAVETILKIAEANKMVLIKTICEKALKKDLKNERINS